MTAPMNHHALLAYYRQHINQVFAISIEVQTYVRSLDGVAVTMERSAHNGLIHATKIGSRHGLPMITLAGFLAQLPGSIAPELALITRYANELAKDMAICTNKVRLYYQYSSGLIKTFARLVQEHPQLAKSLTSNLNLTMAKDLRRLPQLVKQTDLQAIESENLCFVSYQSLENLIHIKACMIRAIELIEKINQQLKRLKLIEMTANYLSLNISMEAVHLPQSQADFKNLSSNIHGMSQVLEKKLTDLLDTTMNGRVMLEQLVTQLAI